MDVTDVHFRNYRNQPSGMINQQKSITFISIPLVNFWIWSSCSSFFCWYFGKCWLLLVWEIFSKPVRRDTFLAAVSRDTIQSAHIHNWSSVFWNLSFLSSVSIFVFLKSTLLSISFVALQYRISFSDFF